VRATGGPWRQAAVKDYFGFQVAVEQLRTVWTLVAYVALLGLCLVNFIHAVQMLTHRHDEGVHYPTLVIGVAVVDTVIKLINFATAGPCT
jgi:hypothetical protein